MFLSNFILVSEQVIILFILMVVGFVLQKSRTLKEEGIKSITNLVLYAVTPCVIINAFQRTFDNSMLRGLVIAFAAALVTHIVCICIASAVIHDRDKFRNRVLKFVIVFSNCGYMSLPLQQAVLGEDGVFYAAAYIAVFNIILWTYGVFLMSGNRDSFSLKKIVLNPGILGTVIGLVLFFCSIKLPEVILSPIKYMASLNTPLPMIVIGYYIAGTNIKKVRINIYEVISVCIRIIICPLLVLMVMHIVGIRGTLLTSCIISSSAPAATATTMFATKFGGNTELSSNLVVVSTILSIVTMPLIVSLSFVL
ncbi:MAG: AEC family transporter [Eubacterium sp.]